MTYAVLYQTARRARAKAAGLCVQCCRRPRVAGLSRCEHCREVNARHRQPGHHCSLCSQEGHDRRTCPAGERVERAPAAATVTIWCDECLMAGGKHRAECKERAT